MRSLTDTILAILLTLPAVAAEPATEAATAALRPVVELEEEVYRFEPANNGAGPMWCSGSTCLVRIGEEVFASGLETLKEFQPLNNCRWLLFKRSAQGWALQQADAKDRTREPCPLACFSAGPLFLSANPTLATDRSVRAGPAQPKVPEFDPANTKGPFKSLLPEWEGSPPFTEHSYRSFAADGPGRELILMQNVGYTHAEWAFRDRQGRWSAKGQLVFPWGAEYPQPRAVRVCYPNVAVKDRAVYFCGVSDIEEPYPEWRAYKKQLTGRDWDYDFRRLFFTWCPDITKGRFAPWVEIATRDKTAGWIMPGDLWVGPDGTVHLLWLERALDERLRRKFFPEARQSHVLNYARLREGKVVLRRALLEAVEGGPREVPSAGRFHVTPDNRLLVVCYVAGASAEGKSVSENRLLEIGPDGAVKQQARLALAHPLSSYFTATVRAGSPPSLTIDLLGHRADGAAAIGYARIRLQ